MRAHFWAVCLLHSVDALVLSGHTRTSRARYGSVRSPRLTEAQTEEGLVCTQLDQATSLLADRSFMDSETTCARPLQEEAWYYCQAPSEDPTVTCFLTPDWLSSSRRAGDGEWLCAAMSPATGGINFATRYDASEDSY